jgi:hypothetical protein
LLDIGGHIPDGREISRQKGRNIGMQPLIMIFEYAPGSTHMIVLSVAEAGADMMLVMFCSTT